MSGEGGVDLLLVAAWLAARSLARGLPAPVVDGEGVRVDAGLPEEARRWIFVELCDQLRALGDAIEAPFVALKLCRSAEELLAVLPPRWRISSKSWVMGREASQGDEVALPSGYEASIERTGPVVFARIVDASGALAASGYAAEAGGVFIYDRIRTEDAHQRRGLGRALMTMLSRERRDPALREILTATAAGRSLYLTMGWRDLAPYSTALIPPA